MRTMRILSILMSVAMAVWMANSCQGKDDFSKKDSNSSISITAFCAYGGENGDQTKTTRKGNGDLWWSPEDEIMVFCGESSGKFVSQNKEGAEIATFVGHFDKEVSTSDISANGVLAFYPYSDDLIREGDAVVFTLPSSQPAVAGTFDDDLYPVIARSENTELSFYNICGGAKFTVSQEGIKTVTIRGNDSEPLAGRLSVTFDENGVPTVEVLKGEKEIVVTTPDGGTFEVDKEYYIVTIPQHFKYGFTLIYNEGLSVHNEFKTKKEILIKRSKFGTLRYLDQELDMIAVTEPIVFEDSKVEELCVANWDTNGDGLLSYAEAAAVQKLGNVFRSNTSITSFDELRYFTGLSDISYQAFEDCSSLTSVTIPSSVTSIRSSAFEDCRSLTSVVIHEGVTSIGDAAFKYCSSLTSVTIPSSVTSIGSYAFYNCSSLTSVTIPSSVTSIRSSAFEDCSSLTSVTIPSSVTSIGSYAFAECRSLTSVTIPEGVTSIGDDAFYNCSGLTSVVILEGVTSIGSSAFENCRSLTSVTILEGVTSIGDYAFANCDLTSVVIPEGVTSIGDQAFYNCSSLTSVTIPSSVTSIGKSAFSYYYNSHDLIAPESVYISDLASWVSIDCGNEYSIGSGKLYLNNVLLTDVVVPDGVTSIRNYAFKYCSSLTSVTIPEGVTSIGSSAFSNCSGLTSVTIPSSVTSMGYYAFYNCSSLTSVTIPEGVTSIGYYAFCDCSSLTSVTIPSSVTSIGGGAFSHCSSLTSVTIPEGVTSIGSYAFSWCSSLTSVTIPSSVTSIGDGAFYNCSSLTSVTIPEGVTSIGSSAFENCRSLTSVTIPSSVTSIGESAFFCSDLQSLYISDLASWLSIDCGDGASLLPEKLYLNNVLLTDVVIPDGVTSIRNYAFYNCSSLTSVTIPEGVTLIGDGAFKNCSSLTSVVIPEGVTSIGDGAFSNCSSLTSVTIPEGVTSIGDDAFWNCSSLTSVTIPEGVTSIGSYAFYNCSSLRSVTIPSSVISICKEAFSDCTALKDVHISDVASWCNISFELDRYGRENYSNPFCYARNLYLNGKLVTDLIIPEGVTSIGDGAFKNCSSLTSVVIPEGVTSIGDGAFSNCSSLTSVTIPSSVTSIGENAFYDCTALKDVHISDVASWCSIDFEKENANPLSYAKNLYLNGESVIDLVIPEGVTSICDYAFYNYNWYRSASVTIPSSVISIDYCAFYSSRLQYVYLKRTTPPTVHSSNFQDCSFIYVPKESLEIYKTRWQSIGLSDQLVGYEF